MRFFSSFLLFFSFIQHASKGGKASPGVFFLFCKEHGHLVGFHAMEDHESPRTVHEVIINRFEHAPQQFIYDNACNVSRFCMSRHPRYWLHTRFIIDRLHVSNHKKCSPAYDPGIVANVVGVHTNTQVAEQHNSVMRVRKCQFFQFSQDMYLFHLRHSVYLMITKKTAARDARMKAATSRLLTGEEEDDEEVSENEGDVDGVDDSEEVKDFVEESDEEDDQE